MDPRLAKTLEDSGVTEYKYFEHPAVETMEEHAKYLPSEEGAIKNLFLKTKKTDKFFLVSCLSSRTVNLKDLQHQLGLENKELLRFAPEEYLEKYLGVVRGSATPFALINDKEKAVRFVLDKDVMSRPELMVHVHPLKNTATVTLRVSELMKFLDFIYVTPIPF